MICVGQYYQCVNRSEYFDRGDVVYVYEVNHTADDKVRFHCEGSNYSLSVDAFLNQFEEVDHGKDPAGHTLQWVLDEAAKCGHKSSDSERWDADLKDAPKDFVLHADVAEEVTNASE